MTPLPLDDIQARADKASAGPWEWDGNPSDYNADQEAPWLIGPRGSRGEPKHIHPRIIEGEVRVPNSADADFIAHARSDVPALVEECRRLRGELEAWAEYGCDGGWKDGLICRDIWEDDVQLDLDCYCGPCRAQAILLGERSALEPSK